MSASASQGAAAVTSTATDTLASSSVAAAAALEASIEAAAQALAKAKRVSAFTGAGMSAESGINTFRDPEVGIWKNKLALALFGTPFGWKWTPWWAWSSYRTFHDPVFHAQPNAGHVALATLGEQLQLPLNDTKKDRNPNSHIKEVAAKDASSFPSSSAAFSPVFIATQNVDYLHQRAGSDKAAVFEIHGSVFRHRCIAKGHPIPLPTDAPLPETQPRCTLCGSRARPDAVLFTENLPDDQWAGATDAMRRLKRGDVLFVIGTSGQVQPAASLPDLCARGVVKIEVNREPSGHTESMDIVVQGPSAECLPRIVARAKALKGIQ